MMCVAKQVWILVVKPKTFIRDHIMICIEDVVYPSIGLIKNFLPQIAQKLRNRNLGIIILLNLRIVLPGPNFLIWEYRRILSRMVRGRFELCRTIDCIIMAFLLII